MKQTSQISWPILMRIEEDWTYQMRLRSLSFTSWKLSHVLLISLQPNKQKVGENRWWFCSPQIPALVESFVSWLFPFINSSQQFIMTGDNTHRAKRRTRQRTWGIPSSRVSCVRNTAALFCITRCMLRRILEVGNDPLAFLSLSNQAMVFSPASFSRGFCFWPIIRCNIN